MKILNINLILILSLLILPGCATLAIGNTPAIKQAGTTSIEVEPVFAPEGQVKVGTKYKALFAKEYKNVNAGLTFDKDGNVTGINFSADTVKAFEGQEIASKTFIEVQAILKEQSVKLSEIAASALKSALLKSLFMPVP